MMTLSILRLNGDGNGGAWCSASPVSRELGNNEWIQVDLGKMHVVTGVKTQGRFGNGRGAEYTEAYKLHYWRPGMTDFIEYHDSLGRTVCQNHMSKACNIISYICSIMTLYTSALYWMAQELLFYLDMFFTVLFCKYSSDNKVLSFYNINNKLMGSNHQNTNLVFPNFFPKFFSICAVEKEN